MAEFNLKMIKIFFVLVIAMFILAMVSGMDILRREKIKGWKKIGMEVDFFRHKQALAARKSENLAPPPNDSNTAGSIPVLLYHGILTGKNWEEDGTNISLEEFREQMFALKEAGYQTVTLAEFFEYMKKGKALPEKSFMLTFDDGRKDSYYEGDPVLKSVGYSAVMFLITGRSLGDQHRGDNFYLGKSELQDMIKSKRWEIQSHGDFDHNWEQVDSSGSKGHFMSNLLWLASENRMETPGEAKNRILKDLASSKIKIEKELGQKTFAYAYPFNDLGQESVNFPESQQFIRDNIGSIYPLTFMQVDPGEPAGNQPDANALHAKRIDVSSEISPADLLKILERNEEKKLPYEDFFWDNRGWKASWGEMKIWGDLTLYKTEEKGGNLSTLLGASSWKNYSVTSLAEISGGNSISQIVRYKNDENYARCNFGKNGIYVFQRVGGNETLLAEKAGGFSILDGLENRLSTGIIGDRIMCYLNGNLLLETQISQALSSGGIGFYFWDESPEKVMIRVKKVNVSAL